MAQTPSNKQRIQVKIVDVDTNEERVSGDIVVMPGYCSYSCCTNSVPPHGACIQAAATQQLAATKQ